MLYVRNMRLISSFVLAISALSVTAQDVDFQDFRSKKESFTKMQEKDIRSELSTFAMAGIDESVGKQPLAAIPATGSGPNFIRFEGRNIQVVITAGPFEAAKHKLKLQEEKHLVKIDNKPFYGSFGIVPKNAIASILVMVNKDTVSIPPVAYADLYNPSFTYKDATGTVKSHNGVYLSSDNRKIYIYMLNTDATGTYEVTWVIQDKKYLRRVLDYELLK